MEGHDDGSAPARRRTHPALGVAVVAVIGVVVAALVTISDLNARIDRLERERASLQRSLAEPPAADGQQEGVRTTVPEVVGLRLDGAQRAIESVGLLPVVDSTTPPGPSPVVTKQVPAGGATLTQGNRVILTLSG